MNGEPGASGKSVVPETATPGRRRWLWAAALAVVAVVAMGLAWNSQPVQMYLLSRADRMRLEDLVAADPNDWRLQYWYGRRSAEEGDLDHGETALRLALGGNPDYVPAYASLGRVLLARGQVEEAYQVLALAAGRDRTETDAHLALAQLYRSQNSFHKAMPLLKDVLERQPDHAEALYELAACHAGLQQFQDAETLLRHALRVAPDNAGYMTALARVRRQRGDLTEAESLARQAVQRQPSDYRARVEWARAVAAQSPVEAKRAEALRILQEARAYAPDEPTIRYELGRVLMAMGRSAEAAVQLERLVQLMPNSTGGYYLLSKAYLQSGRSREARQAEASFRHRQSYERRVQDLSEQLGANPADTATRIRLIDLYAAEGDYRRAIAQCRKVLETDPGSAETRRRMADLVRRQVAGQPPQATGAAQP